ncbi:MAG: hypothetical protein A3B29_02140 [Candidatus Sungbacteria bacterium RIFCSPLOWO2_01_FULL_51_34]|nr:MAG: hypothetical protein A3B29_02140 [Candidatus Sungbacteria bacterium RIFCSPLOWO2_01_FULL_51_34]
MLCARALIFSLEHGRGDVAVFGKERMGEWSGLVQFRLELKSEVLTWKFTHAIMAEMGKEDGARILKF